jgi:hypothetical protein
MPCPCYSHYLPAQQTRLCKDVRLVYRADCFFTVIILYVSIYVSIFCIIGDTKLPRYKKICYIKLLMKVTGLKIMLDYEYLVPVPVAARSKPEVCDRRGHGSLSVLGVVCCQVEFSATD